MATALDAPVYVAMQRASRRLGISVPPTGAVDQDGITQRSPWDWASRDVDGARLFEYDVNYVSRQLIDRGPFFACSYVGWAGHGYATSVVTCGGSIAAFVQHRDDRDRRAVNATYARLRDVVSNPGRGQAAVAVRWLASYSDFHDRCALLQLGGHAGGGRRPGSATEYETEDDLWSAAAELLRHA